MAPMSVRPVKTNVMVKQIIFSTNITKFLHLNYFRIHFSNMSLLCPALFSVLSCFYNIYIPTCLRAKLHMCLPFTRVILYMCWG